MRDLLTLLEDLNARGEFLAAIEIWASDMQNSDYESNKPEIEEILLRHEEIAAAYRQVEHKALFRGTGISHGELAALRRGERVTVDMSESRLTSWSTNPEVASRFVQSYYRHFEGDHAIVAVFATSAMPVFLDFRALWAGMTKKEQKYYQGIRVAVEENEVIVQHSPEFVITKENVYATYNREDFPEDEDDDEAEDDGFEAAEAAIAALSPAEARSRLHQEAMKRYAAMPREKVERRLAELSDLQVREFLLAWATGQG